MADPTKLGIYNDALLILGERKLNTITDNVPTRYDLDSAWDMSGESFGGIDYCLELVQPYFSSTVEKLTGGVTSTEHGYTKTYTLNGSGEMTNDDYMSLRAVFIDDQLDQPLTRFFMDGEKLSCNFDPIYIQYNADNTFAIPSGTDYSKLTHTFIRVVSTYLARELCLRYAPDRFEKISALFDKRVEEARYVESAQAPMARSKEPTGTLTSDWVKIYNDALTILGKDKLVVGSDDSPYRSFMDTAVDSGIVSSILEEGFWGFASTTTKSSYDTGVTPDFGPSYAHAYPSDMHSIIGIYVDEDLQVPLEHYQDEGDYIYSYHQEYYIQYVKNTFLTDPSSWPTVFKRYVAAQIANDIVILAGGDPNKVETELQRRKQKAESWDVQQSPPRKLSRGKWSGARISGRKSEQWIQ